MKMQNKKYKFSAKCSLGFIALTVLYVDVVQASNVKAGFALSFENAIKTAQKNDPWLTGNINKQRALESMSQAVNTLSDAALTDSYTHLTLPKNHSVEI